MPLPQQARLIPENSYAGVGNLGSGAGNTPRYDARRMVELLIAGLRHHARSLGR